MGNEHWQAKKSSGPARKSDRGVPHNAFKSPKFKRGQYPRRPDEESITDKVEKLKLLSKHF